MRIRVEPDVLRALSKQIQYAAEQIQQKMTVLDQAIHSLEWEVESRAAVMNEWNHSKRLGEDALRRLMDLSVRAWDAKRCYSSRQTWSIVPC